GCAGAVPPRRAGFVFLLLYINDGCIKNVTGRPPCRRAFAIFTIFIHVCAPPAALRFAALFARRGGSGGANTVKIAPKRPVLALKWAKRLAFFAGVWY